jgi:hypothetical protein
VFAVLGIKCARACALCSITLITLLSLSRIVSFPQARPMFVCNTNAYLHVCYFAWYIYIYNVHTMRERFFILRLRALGVTVTISDRVTRFWTRSEKLSESWKEVKKSRPTPRTLISMKTNQRHLCKMMTVMISVSISMKTNKRHLCKMMTVTNKRPDLNKINDNR